MSRPRCRSYRSRVLAALLLICAASPTFAQFNPDVTRNDTLGPIGRYLPFEITLAYPTSGYTQPFNPFWDVTIDATFTSPGGVSYSIGGFYYDTDKWMVRFSPLIEGMWSYALAVTAPGGTYATNGTFQCVSSTLSGPLRRHPTNPMRLIRDDGTAFNGIGTNMWTFVHPFLDDGLHNGWIGGRCAPLEDRWSIYFAAWQAKGGNLFRQLLGNEGAAIYDITHCDFVPPQGQPNPYDSFDAYIGIWHDNGPAKYSTQRALILDVELREARKHDIAVVLTMLDKHLFWSRNPLNACNGGPFCTVSNCNVPAQCQSNHNYPSDFFKLVNGGAPVGSAPYYYEQYFRYIVNRYSAFVDVWELFSEYDESTGTVQDHYGLDDPWKSYMAQRIRDFHPYNDLVTNGTPNQNTPVTDPWQDVLDAHKYTYTDNLPGTGPVDLCEDCGPGYNPTIAAQKVDELYAPLTTVAGRGERPLMFGECGFYYNLANDDPVYFRIVVWMAFHRNADVAFWDAQFRYDCNSHPDCDTIPNGLFVSSTYQTPVSRNYYQLRQTYAAKVPATARIAATPPSGFDASKLRAWAISTPDGSAYSTYVHNYDSHTQFWHSYPVQQNKKITITGLTSGSHRYAWVDPKTGADVETGNFTGVSKTFDPIPNFVQDIALLITPDEPVHIVTPSIPTPDAGAPYFQLLEASGGGMPYTWSIVSGGLPVGMQLDAQSGLISGSPTFGGNNQFTVRVTAQDASFDEISANFHWTLTVDSIGAEDGYVSMGAGPGNPKIAFATDSSASGIRMGDNQAQSVFRGVVSFSTSALPDAAVIDSAELDLTSEASAGATGGFPPRVLVVKNGTFGTGALQGTDFNAAGTATQTFPNIGMPPNPWLLPLDGACRAAINPTGKTQMRIQWDLDTDGDAVSDWTGFCPGEFSVVAKRPHLVVTYH